jgi:CHAD domain-containing protein
MSLTLRIDRETPLWIASRALLAQRGDDFRRRLAIVLQAYDPEAIHDLRVSSRRLREGLALFAPCYPAAPARRVDRRVRTVTRMLGEIRNRDEAALFFSGLRNKLDAACRSALESLTASLEQERGAELARLKEGLCRTAAADFHRQYRRLTDFPEIFPADGTAPDLFVPLEEFGRQALGARLAGLMQLVPAARVKGNAAERHQLRIAVKHFRYRLEILSHLFGERYDDGYAAVKSYQEVLGKLQDLDVFAGICRAACMNCQVEATILDAMVTRQNALFAKFTAMLERMPFEKIGSRLGLNIEPIGG